jgi:hypothetical protein
MSRSCDILQTPPPLLFLLDEVLGGTNSQRTFISKTTSKMAA